MLADVFQLSSTEVRHNAVADARTGLRECVTGAGTSNGPSGTLQESISLHMCRKTQASSLRDKIETARTWSLRNSAGRAYSLMKLSSRSCRSSAIQSSSRCLLRCKSCPPLELTLSPPPLCLSCILVGRPRYTTSEREETEQIPDKRRDEGRARARIPCCPLQALALLPFASRSDHHLLLKTTFTYTRHESRTRSRE